METVNWNKMAAVYIIIDSRDAHYIGQGEVALNRLNKHKKAIDSDNHCLVGPCEYYILEWLPETTADARRIRERYWQNKYIQSGKWLFRSCKKDTKAEVNAPH